MNEYNLVSELDQQYIQEVQSLVSKVCRERRRVAIFGASRGGWYVKKVLEYYGVNILAFIDNDIEKRGHFQGCPVLSPDAVLAHTSRVMVFLGIFNHNTAKSVKSNLVRDYGPDLDVISCLDAMLFIYLSEIANRNSNPVALANGIHILFKHYAENNWYGETRDGEFVAPFTTVVITQKCTLRCRDCGQMIPYYRNPVHFPVETIVRDIEKYAQAFDVVPEISLHGGEPFLYPDLVRLCREIATIPNIVFINFITNGTLLPRDEIFAVMSECGVDIHQSDYGRYSKKQSHIWSACRKHGIFCDVLYTTADKNWLQMPPLRKHNRSPEKNQEIYRQCVDSNICCQIMAGELHRCAISLHASKQGVIPLFKDDWVDLGCYSNVELRPRIRRFFTGKTVLRACDYCDPQNAVVVPPALQLPCG